MQPIKIECYLVCAKGITVVWYPKQTHSITICNSAHLRIGGSVYLHCPIRHHGVAFEQLNRRTTLSYLYISQEAEVAIVYCKIHFNSVVESLSKNSGKTRARWRIESGSLRVWKITTRFGCNCRYQECLHNLWRNKQGS
jgi:hypothetical protein